MPAEENVFLDKTNEYIKFLSVQIKSIKMQKPDDRLEHAVVISNCLKILNISIKGWFSWFNSLDQLNHLTEEDLKDIFSKMKKLVIKFLELDLEITKRKLLEAETVLKAIKKSVKKKRQKATYVS